MADRIELAKKQSILKEVEEGIKPKTQIAKENGIATSTIAYWQGKKKTTKKAAGPRRTPRKGAFGNPAESDYDQLDNLVETVRRIRLMNGQARELLALFLKNNPLE